MSEIKQAVKSAKTNFDLQLEAGEKRPGISFAIKSNNNIEYANIPTIPDQKFRYFYNPSSLTAEERKRVLQGQVILKKPDEDDEP